MMLEHAVGAELSGCLSVVVPCYNEMATIKAVLERVLESPYTSHRGRLLD